MVVGGDAVRDVLGNDVDACPRIDRGDLPGHGHGAGVGGVITSAGLILAGTFATLGTLPLVILTEIGVTVAIGVLIDTVIVRSVLVTALTLDIGRWMWWPSRLARPSPVEISPQEAAAVTATASR